MLNRIATTVTAYKGNISDPHWQDTDPGTSTIGAACENETTHGVRLSEYFVPLCTIHADTSAVKRTPRDGPDGQFFVQVYNIVLICGLTELKAQISWTENVSAFAATSLDQSILTDFIETLASLSHQGEEKRFVRSDSDSKRISSGDSLHRGPATVVYDDDPQELR